MSVAASYARRPLPRALLVFALATAFAWGIAPAAHAASIGEKIILRCTHGESLAGFSQADYRQALEQLSSDTEEYSQCGAEIRQAEAAAARRRGSSGTGSAAEAAPMALAASPSELQSLAKASKQGSGGVAVGGQVVHPGVVHADVASALSTLPAPLLAVLAAMVACVLVLAAYLVRKRVRGGRPD